MVTTGKETDFSNRVALITGGSKGIGKAVALNFSRKGIAVAVNYNSSEEAAEEVVTEILGQGGKAIKVKAEVSNVADVREMFKVVMDAFGRLDILVNNAGISGEANLLKITESDWDKVLAINLKGVFNCCQAAVAIFLEQPGGGKIINISSIAGKMGGLAGVQYAASKAGVIGLTMALSTEFANKNIWVNAIAPGPVRTEMFESMPESVQKHLAGMSHVGRVCEPEEIAHAVSFLVENDYMAGETINMSAGRYMD